MDEARRRQIEIWKAWTPEQRLAAAGRLTQLLLDLRDARLRRDHPGATDEDLRQLRLAEALRADARISSHVEPSR
ncbi:MAG: hypothetical protein AB7O52_10940 [Planctomycetota bacterium]